jgi:two-component system, chemotaxis family, protein-glutamate methylesterase/glutaminase
LQQEIVSDETISTMKAIGKVSPLTCPESNGALWEMNDTQLFRFRCHVGHGFSLDSLAEGQSQMLEKALWSALRSLDEKLELTKRMIERARQRNQQGLITRFEHRLQQTEEHASVIRRVLLSGLKNDLADNAA